MAKAKAIKTTPVISFSSRDRVYPRDVINYDRLPIDPLQSVIKVTKNAQARLNQLGMSNLRLRFAIPAITMFGQYPSKPVLNYDAETQQFKLDFRFELVSCDPVADAGTMGLPFIMGITTICIMQRYHGRGQVIFSDKFEQLSITTKLTSAQIIVVDQDGKVSPAMTELYLPASERSSYTKCPLDRNNKRTALFYDCRQYLGIDYDQVDETHHIGLLNHQKYAEGLEQVAKFHDELGEGVRAEGGDVNHYFATPNELQ